MNSNIKKELLALAGDEDDEFTISKTVSAGYLRNYSTVCGDQGNRPFDAELIDWLESNDVTKAHITVSADDEESIIACILDLSEGDAEDFSEEVAKRGGSLVYQGESAGLSAFCSE